MKKANYYKKAEGFIRLAAAVPKLSLADPKGNEKVILGLIDQAVNNKVNILVFPELSLTGYSLGDLFHQDILQQQTLESLKNIVIQTKGKDILFFLGLPIGFESKLLNVAAAICNGKILGFVPKTYVPGYKEFYEERWFASARDLVAKEIFLWGDKIPFGADLLFRVVGHPEIIVGAEICEDVWVPLPPSSFKAVAGANILVNLSASNELIGKADYRRDLVVQQSARGVCGYVYVSCGVNESTTDVVYGGHALIAENGHLLKESERFLRDSQIIYSDLDVNHLLRDRERITSFGESVHESSQKDFRFIDFSLRIPEFSKLERWIDPYPFVPSNLLERDKRAEEIFAIQAAGLAKRLEYSEMKNPIIGISGGLDSTLALLVAVKSCELLGIPVKNIKAFTMPGFATTKRTKLNAFKLAHALGVTIEEIDITAGASQHFKDLKHNGKTQDLVFQNVQARYRTMVLMDKANQLHGLVVGTGDLSEIALGWNTFTGDQISHYNVNAGIPKTLVKYLVGWVSQQKNFLKAKKVLKDILDTPISPELIGSRNASISQKTEDLIGPYELHDFFLYHFLRWGSAPKKILFLAGAAFGKKYSAIVIKKWLKVFIERFFRNQWKRSVMPDGPKVGSVSLSPRGDWRTPSDAEVKLWLSEL